MNKSLQTYTPHSLASLFAGLACCAAIAGTITGCGDDESSTTVVALGPPAIGIVAPQEGACVVLTDDDATVRVQIELQNWSLRPEGFCGGVYSQCGFAVFMVDGQEVVRSSSLVTDVPLVGLPSPAGNHRIRVELRDDDDEVQLDREREPLVAERSVLTVDATETCP